MKNCIATFLLFILAGCFHDESKDIENTKSSKLNITEHIVGIWKTACFSLETSKYVKLVVKFDNKYFRYLEYYDDSNCSGIGSPDSPIVSNYKIGNYVLTESGLNAYELDSNILDVSNLDTDKYSTDTLFDILFIDGSKLYLGDSASYITRPMSLNIEEIYYKN